MVLKQQGKRKIYFFKKSYFEWKDVNAIEPKVCQVFDDEIISAFMTTFPLDFGEEQVEIGTKKPTRKGKALYLSDKIQHCEFTSDSAFLKSVKKCDYSHFWFHHSHWLHHFY